MITEDYVSYKVARLLQEKGFDEVCFACYEYFISSVTLYSGWQFEYKGETVRNTDERVKCPTLQMAMKWLREVHNIFISIDIYSKDFKGNIRYCADIYKHGSRMVLDTPIVCDTYEKVCETACIYVLKNLI